MITKSPHSFLDVMGFEKYLGTLRLLAAHYSTLRTNSSLLSAMKTSAFLVGLFNETKSEAEETRSGTEQQDKKSMEFRLATAREINLIDDAILARIFTPLGYCFLTTNVKLSA